MLGSATAAFMACRSTRMPMAAGIERERLAASASAPSVVVGRPAAVQAA